MKHHGIGFALMLVLALGLFSCDSEKSLTPTSNAVHGVVVDQNGKPISGANVAARRARVQAVTDENGEYALPKAEALDGPDTLDMTDNKLIRVAMPITWKVKRFEDAVVVKRKLTGSVAGNLGGLSKARIHWRTKGALEGVPQLVDLENGKYEGEIATLFSKDSLEVQVFLLDTALRVVGKSRFLQINPRSGNIVVPAFSNLSIFEPLSPVYGCVYMGSWDTCSIALVESEDSATQMWFREGSDVWSGFRGTFTILPRLRRMGPLWMDNLYTEIEILRRDSAGVERLDTLRIPWQMYSPDPILQFQRETQSRNWNSVDFQEAQEFVVDVGYKVHSELAKIQVDLVYGTYQIFKGPNYCDKVDCSQEYRSSLERGVIPDLKKGKQSVCFPKGVFGNMYMVLRVAVDDSEKYYSDTVFLRVAPSVPENQVAFVRWDSIGFVLQLEKPIDNVAEIDFVNVEGSVVVNNFIYSKTSRGYVGEDKRTIFFRGEDIDSLTEGGWGVVKVPMARNPNDISKGYYPNVRIPASPASQRLRKKFRNKMDSVIVNLGRDSDHLVQYAKSENGFDVRASDWFDYYGKQAFGGIFWKDTLPSNCPRKIRFRASGTDSTLLRVYTNVGIDYHPRPNKNYIAGLHVGRELLIGDSARWYYPLDHDRGWNNAEWFDGLWPFVDWRAMWEQGIMASLSQTMIVGLCGNVNSDNCPEKRWLTVTDIEVYSDCSDPVSGVVQ